MDFDGASIAIVTFVDGYDAVGNRTSRIKDGVATTWVYDAVYRLTGQGKSGQAATFVYDSAGNMTVKHHEGSNPLTMSYDAGNRITTSVLGSSRLTTFTHDANGNTTGERCDTLGVLSTYHTRFNEKAAGEVIAACGLANVCGPGGVYREGGGK